MSLTKEMIMLIDDEVKMLDDDLLKVYNNTYRILYKDHPNSFFDYRIKKSNEEMITRGIDESAR